MGRQALDHYWLDRLRSLAEQNPTWGSRKIAGALEMEGAQAGRSDFPAEATVRKYLNQHRAASEADRIQYRLYAWPQTHQRGALPWEAAPACLELLRYCDEARRPAPTVRQAGWFSRLRLAAPNLPTATAWSAAIMLAAAEGASAAGAADPGLMWYLAYQPWAGMKELDAYTAARTRADAPIPSVSLVASNGSALAAVLREVLLSTDTDASRSVVRHLRPMPTSRQTVPVSPGASATEGENDGEAGE